MVELVYNSTRSPTVNVRKGESIAKVRFNFFSSTNIRIIIIYMDTNTDHFTPLALRVRGNESLPYQKHRDKELLTSYAVGSLFSKVSHFTKRDQ